MDPCTVSHDNFILAQVHTDLRFTTRFSQFKTTNRTRNELLQFNHFSCSPVTTRELEFPRLRCHHIIDFRLGLVVIGLRNTKRLAVVAKLRHAHTGHIFPLCIVRRITIIYEKTLGRVALKTFPLARIPVMVFRGSLQIIIL